MAGKLYMYNGEQQQFVERGYGILKINESHQADDWNHLHARLSKFQIRRMSRIDLCFVVMRLDRSFRVILNSPIFPKMTVERATDRSVRFGAQDESQLRVFIIKVRSVFIPLPSFPGNFQSSSNDCSNFCKELQSRIQIVERQQQTPVDFMMICNTCH